MACRFMRTCRFFSSKDLFKKAGLDPEKPPTSLAEISEYAKKITALGDGNYGYYLPGAPVRAATSSPSAH